MRIEEGKYYRDRTSDIHGPMARSVRYDFPRAA